MNKNKEIIQCIPADKELQKIELSLLNNFVKCMKNIIKSYVEYNS